MLGPGRRRLAGLRRLRRPRHPRVLHPRALPQARRGPDRRPPARGALRALLGGGHRGPRGRRPRPAHHHLAGRGVPPPGRDRRPTALTLVDRFIELGPAAFRFLEREQGYALEIPTGFRWQPQLVYRDASDFVIVALDDRERSFDVVLGPLGVAERPDPAAGRSLRELLASAGEDPPPFSFD